LPAIPENFSRLQATDCRWYRPLDLFSLLEESARLLDRETDPAMLNDRLDQLEFVYDAVTDGEMPGQVTDLIERYCKRLTEPGSG
jgi:hypothetical protein